MERQSEKAVSGPRTRIGQPGIRTSLAAIAAAIAGAVGACGGQTPPPQETEPKEPVDVCIAEEQVDDPAPKVENPKHEKVNSTQFRVAFTVPQFDACLAPLEVRVAVNGFINPEHEGAGENSNPARVRTELEGVTWVYEPGEYFVDARCERGYDDVTSYVLIVTDQEGRVREVGPFSMY